MLNHNKAHETAGILRQKINYISVVNTIIEKAKSKEESVHILENKALRKKKKNDPVFGSIIITMHTLYRTY